MTQTNFERRMDQMSRIANDEALELSDKLKYIYNSVMLEYSVLFRDSFQRRINKRAIRLQELVEIFNFQHELKDL